MEKGDIYAEVEKYIGRFAKPSTLPIVRNTPLSNLGLDSLDKVELLFEIEAHFDIQISDEIAGRLRTVEDLVAFLKRNARQNL